MATSILSVPSISCGHCRATITNALAPLAGVQGVTVDIPTKQVTVEYDSGVVTVDQFTAALDDEGYPVESAA